MKIMQRHISEELKPNLFLKKNYPKTAAIIEKMIAPKIESKLNQLELIDSDQFRKYRQYMIYLFQKKDV